MSCVLIMAGGKGTRFWPKSVEDKPKQFLSLIGEKTMIQLTVDRVRRLYPIDQIFICTLEKYKNIVREQIPDMKEENIIIEPTGRNTAPCILLSTLHINEKYPDSNIIVLPSDHIINNEKRFLKILKQADDFIIENHDGIVTIGVVPNRPETGYGYIKFKESEDEILEVDEFVEKPNMKTALKYLSSGKYLWNAGMFAFNSTYMLNEYNEKCREMYELLNSLPSIYDLNYDEILSNVYEKCEKISFDYAIMEKSDKTYVVPSDFGWDDVGTWDAIGRYVDEDYNSNILKGDVEIKNSKNCVVYGNGKKIILIDVEDIFCIDSDDVIVIGKKDKINTVHEYRDK